MSIVQREIMTGVYLINVSGPLTSHPAEQLSRCFQDLFVREIEGVIVNLAETPFMDGPGLAALLTGYKFFGSEGRSFQLVGLQDQPRLVLELTGFDRIFQVLDRMITAEIDETPQPAWSSQVWMFTPQATALVDMAA